MKSIFVINLALLLLLLVYLPIYLMLGFLVLVIPFEYTLILTYIPAVLLACQVILALITSYVIFTNGNSFQTYKKKIFVYWGIIGLAIILYYTLNRLSSAYFLADVLSGTLIFTGAMYFVYLSYQLFKEEKISTNL